MHGNELGCQIKFILDRKTVVVGKLLYLVLENHNPYFTLLSTFLYCWDLALKGSVQEESNDLLEEMASLVVCFLFGIGNMKHPCKDV